VISPQGVQGDKQHVGRFLAAAGQNGDSQGCGEEGGKRMSVCIHVALAAALGRLKKWRA